MKNQPDLTQIDLPNLIRKAIRKNAKQMLAPLFRRCKGIRTKLPNKLKTGNASFGKIQAIISRSHRSYAGRNRHRRRRVSVIYTPIFLEQAANISPRVKIQTGFRTNDGNWRYGVNLRDYAVKQCKKPTNEGYHTVAEYLRDIANKEQQIWQTLRNL